MCSDPKCKAHIKQAKLELKQAKELRKAIPPNGRCDYHEGTAKAVYYGQGMMAVIVILLGVLVHQAIGLNEAAKTHSYDLSEVKTSQAVLQLTLNTHRDEGAHTQMRKDFEEHIERVKGWVQQQGLPPYKEPR